jgi:hypothetical protein
MDKIGYLVTDREKGAIQNYILIHLSKEHIKANWFLQKTGLDMGTISNLKKSSYWSKISNPAWNYLLDIYKENKFADVVAGEYPAFSKNKKKVKEQPSTPKEIPNETSPELLKEKDEIPTEEMLYKKNTPPNIVPVTKEQRELLLKTFTAEMTTGQIIDILIEKGLKVEFKFSIG